MRKINEYINEKLNLTKDFVPNEYHFHPKDKAELKLVIAKLLKERGNSADMTDVDTSEITDMSRLFKDFTDIEDIDISNWDVSKVITMESMFSKCKKFNCDLSVWNTENCKDMFCMFNECERFNSNLNAWNVEKVDTFKSMFYNCKSFNGDITKWKPKEGADFDYMLYGCEKFKHDLTSWGFKESRHATYMFKNSGVRKIPAWAKRK